MKPGDSAGDAQPALSVSISAAQMARLLTGLLWVAWAAWLDLQPPAPLALQLSAVITVCGVATMVAALLVRDPARTRLFDLLLLAGTMALAVLLPAVNATVTGYATDELAFDQSAAASVLHGVNPYAVDFSRALPAFGVNTGTMTLHGTMEPYLSYPALSFLLYIPAVAFFGPHSYAGAFVDTVAWSFSGWLMWRLLEARLRPWIPVVLAMPVLLTSVMTGVTDPLFLPFVILAVYRWDRFADPASSRLHRWAGPAGLGLACCVKQQPWLLAPFLLIGVFVEARRRGLPAWRFTGAYAGIAAIGFLVPNIPFILRSPGAWVSRLLIPLTGALVPMGLGPAGLTRPLGLGGGNLALFGAAAALMLVATVVLYIGRYSQLRRMLPLLPLAALFLSTRSFASYFVFAMPAALVNCATVGDGPAALPQRLRRRVQVVAATAAVLALLLAAGGLLVKPPLRIDIVSSGASPTLLTVVAEVRNTSSDAVTPHFFLAKDEYYNQEFTTQSGPPSLQPGQVATYTFTAVEYPATPHPGDGLQVEAGSLSPDAVSTSPVVAVAAVR